MRIQKASFQLLFTVLFIFYASVVFSQDRVQVILDADTANEVDDLYALSVILMDSTVEFTALNATHWQTAHWATEQTMEDSHRLNQMLLGIMGLEVNLKRGATARMYDWGDRAQYSAAAYEIIRQAKAIKGNGKLNIIAMGALTNVASAVFIEPSIAKNIKLYWLGTTYDFEKDIMYKDDFNCAMDQYALSYLLFSKVEMNIVPLNVASKMTFDYEETHSRLENHILGDFLLKIWEDHIDGGRRQRTIWDLSIVNAFLHPEWMEQEEITTSRDNGNRKLIYYTDFDADKMRTDFFEKIKSYERN